MSVTTTDQQQPQQQQEQQQQETPTEAALRAELIATREQMTAMQQQQPRQVSAVATTSKPPQPQNRPGSTRTKPQGGSIPKPTRPPCTPRVPEPELPPKFTTEECYTIMSDWASDSADHTATFHQDQLDRQEKEYLQLVQNSQPSKDAEEEHTMWCE